MSVATTRRRHLVLALRLIVPAALVGLALWQLDLAAVAARLAGLDPLPAAAGCAVLLAGQSVSALRWRALAARWGLRASPAWFASAYLRGCLYNTVLPTGLGGDAVRVGLARRLGPTGAAARSVLADRLVGFAALAVTAALLAPLASGYLPAGSAPVVLAVDALLVVGGAWLVARYGLPTWVGWTLLFELVWCTGVWLLAAAVGLRLAPAAVPVVVLVVGVALALPISVGGTGVREAGFVAALAPLDVAAPAAVALGVAFGAALALIGLCGAIAPLPALATGPTTR